VKLPLPPDEGVELATGLKYARVLRDFARQFGETPDFDIAVKVAEERLEQWLRKAQSSAATH
jgi:hypothetical protein